jgi:hypothetical protein
MSKDTAKPAKAPKAPKKAPAPAPKPNPYADLKWWSTPKKDSNGKS